MAQTDPLTIATPTPNPTSPPKDVHHRNRTKTKSVMDTTMAHIPQLEPFRDNDPHLGRSYHLPPQFYPSAILAPHLGQINLPNHAVTIVVPTTIQITLLSRHLPPAPHHGPSFPATLIEPFITAEMPNVESRQNPKLSQTINCI